MIECVGTTLFCDIINSTQIANILGSRDYYEFIQEFYGVSEDARRAFLKGLDIPERKSFVQWDARGDEICIIFYSPLLHLNDGQKGESLIYRDIEDALKIAVNLKLMWWSNPRNRNRINEQKQVFDLGIGIHSGVMGFEETKDGGFSKPIGYSINVAKRVESNTRNGRFSRIMLSHSVSQYLRDREELKYVVQLVSAGLMSAKGVDDMSIYEVCSFKWFSDFFSFTDISPETVDSFYKEFRQNPHNVWIGNLLANIEFQKQEFRKANRIFQQLAEMEGNSAEFFNNVGVTYTLMGEESRGCLLLAEEAFSKAVSLDRFNPEYLFNMANLCYRMDRFEEAYNYSLKTLTLEREFPGAKDLNQMILITLEKHKPGIAPAQPGKEDAEADEKTGGGHLGKYFKWRD